MATILWNNIYRERQGIIGAIYKKFISYAIQSPYVDKVIVTSYSEIDKYSKVFNLNKDKFSFVRWGAVDYSNKFKIDNDLRKKKYIFSTGRSNRDYNFLVKSLEKTSYNLVIATDTMKAYKKDNIQVYNDIFDDKMIHYMFNSFCVVISLEDTEIAAGQLVLLHAMNCGKPVIITYSKGVTDDYIIPMKNGIIIEKNRDNLLNALHLLYKDKDIYQNISRNAQEMFHTTYTKYKLGENLGKVIEKDIISKRRKMHNEL